MKNVDWRVLENGLRIPTEAGYCDQPSIVKAKDGTWICSVTTGKGEEGAKGQYVNITHSNDHGKSWSEPIAIEEPTWESAYSSLAIAPSGRIYCFYCYNLDHVDINDVPLVRYDMGGYYCYRYSDDNGVTWSERHIVPVRDFEMDEQQEEQYKSYRGKPLRFFWNVSRVFFEGDTCFSALIKYHYDAKDVLNRSEGVLLRCKNLDKHPEAGEWETLPDGKIGLRTPEGGGRVAEEQSFVILSDGTIYTTYRTIDGHPACAWSCDYGQTFTTDYIHYSDGRPMKHNRAATFIWPLGNKQYLYWFNNQGMQSYSRRNPIWCSLAKEIETPQGMNLAFSEPEILLYHESEHVIISYPDLLYDDGWYITETQKLVARMHPIDSGFMKKLCADTLEVKDIPVYSWRIEEKEGRVPEIVFSQGDHKVAHDQRFLSGEGYTLSLWIKDAQASEEVWSTWTSDGGIEVKLNSRGYLAIRLGDTFAECTLEGSIALDDCAGHHIAIILDNRANIIYTVIDGKMDDGGEKQRSGWRWMNRAIIAIPGGKAICGRSLCGADLYSRALMTREAAVLRLIEKG